MKRIVTYTAAQIEASAHHAEPRARREVIEELIAREGITHVSIAVRGDGERLDPSEGEAIYVLPSSGEHRYNGFAAPVVRRRVIPAAVKLNPVIS